MSDIADLSLKGNFVDDKISYIFKWVKAGYEKSSVESFKIAVIQTAKNPNVAIDIRFAGTDVIYFAFADEIC